MDYEQIKNLFSIHGELKDGFIFYNIFDYEGAKQKKDAIVIYENIIASYVDYINKNKIDKLIIYIFPEGISSLDFLLKVPHVKYLRIIGDVDYKPLYNLANIRLVEISGNNVIEIDKIEGLESFHSSSPDSMQISKTIATLKTLSLSANEKKSNKLKNLSFLSKMPNIDSLNFHCTEIDTLQGIEALKHLKVLVLINNKKLYNIESLNEVSKSLKHLYIVNSNKIENYDIIGSLKELVFLAISNIKTIQSLHFINKLEKLKTFLSEESNVIDGDITPIINLNHTVFFPLRKHYFKTVRGEKMKVSYDDFSYKEREKGDEEIDLWRRFSLK